MRFFCYFKGKHVFYFQFDAHSSGMVASAFCDYCRGEINGLNPADFARFVKSFMEFENAMVGN